MGAVLWLSTGFTCRWWMLLLRNGWSRNRTCLHTTNKSLLQSWLVNETPVPSVVARFDSGFSPWLRLVVSRWFPSCRFVRFAAESTKVFLLRIARTDLAMYILVLYLSDGVADAEVRSLDFEFRFRCDVKIKLKQSQSFRLPCLVQLYEFNRTLTC